MSEPITSRALHDKVDELEAQLRAREQELAACTAFHEEIFRSFSWRVTAPLRKLRVLLGAPAPPLAPVQPDDPAQPRAPWDSLVPEALPDSYRVTSADEAVRHNAACEIIQPQWMLEGLVPQDLVRQRIGDDATTPASLYHGSLQDPPTIAFLGSAELASDLAFDARVVRLDEQGWREQLSACRYELLLIEPVWHVDNRQWRNAMFRDGSLRPALESLLDYAGRKGTPRVLWFRASVEAVPAFGWLTAHVDAVYGVDEDSARALSELSGRSVSPLPPAIQPALHNPFRSWEQLALSEDFSNRVLFDGWFDLMEGAALDPLLEALRDEHLLVAESEWEFGGQRLADCPDFMRNAAGCLTPAGKVALAKLAGAEVFRDSPLVPSWRRKQSMARSVACGTIAVDASGGAGQQWGQLPLTGGAEQLELELRSLLADPLQRARCAHLAFREIAGQHCVADRLNVLAGDLDLEVRFGRRPPQVACLLVTMRPELLPGCIQRFRDDLYPYKELVVVLHGCAEALDWARALARPGEPIRFYALGKDLALGACLNFAFAQSTAEYWAKFDDDDLYGPHYLSDIMLYHRAVDFAVGGKPAAFVYSEADDTLYWDRRCTAIRSRQWRRAGRRERVQIAGGTLVGRRDVLAEVPFSHVRRRGSDSEFIRQVDSAGVDFHAFDSFNFALFRSARKGFHTWNPDAGDLRKGAIPVGSRAEVRDLVFA